MPDPDLPAKAAAAGWTANPDAPKKRAMGLNIPPRVADRISSALVPMIEMFKAVPAEAPDECKVQAVILRRDLRLAHEAGTAILNEATVTKAGSIVCDVDRLDAEDRDRLLKTLLKPLIPGLHYAALAEESGLDIDRITSISEGLNA